MTELAPHTQYAALRALPALVRKQRRLEAKIVPVAPLIDQEKAVRKDIDALLLKAGLARGEGVTCLGYDVTHRDRKGQTSLNQDKLTEQLVAAGVKRVLIDRVIAASTETGDPAQWAEVKPSKGSKVRTS